MTQQQEGRLYGSRFTTFLMAASLVLATGLAYAPGLSGGFIFDDYATLVDNTRLHIKSLEIASISRAATSFEPGGAFNNRPVAMISFALNHAIHGLDPWGYKLGGLLVHLTNALLVFALVHRVLTLPTMRSAGWATHGAAIIALLWAIHPLQVSTVLYVVQRMETLSLTFVLLALLAYLRGRRQQLIGRPGWRWLLACIPLVGLGLAAKETAALFPAYTLALELTVLGFGAQRARTARNWRWSYGIATSAGLLLFVFVIAPHYWSDAHTTRNFGTAERLLTQLRVLPLYLGQILVPLPASMPFYYDHIAPSRGLLFPVSTLLGGLVLVGLAAVALLLRKRAPLIALGTLWFLGAHVLTSNVVPLELVFEHRNYFALLGVVLVLADLARRIPMRDGPALKYVAIAGISLALAVLTLIRSSTWGDPLLLASELASNNPSSGRASADLAAVYLEMTDGYSNSPFNDFAMREFERGSLIPGSSIVSDQGLILTAAQAGRPINDAWWQRLIDKVEHGQLSPETTGALFGLLQNRYNGVALDDDRLIDAFLALFRRVSLPPHSYAQFGDYVLTKVGDQHLADQVFGLAIDRSRSHPDYARQIVEVLRKEGHDRQAHVALARAHELGLLLDIPLAEQAPAP